jgi:hypothetical protein
VQIQNARPAAAKKRHGNAARCPCRMIYSLGLAEESHTPRAAETVSS